MAATTRQLERACENKGAGAFCDELVNHESWLDAPLWRAC
jgi:hypothetical protein